MDSITYWNARIIGAMPILEVKGESMNLGCGKDMLEYALILIEKADEYKGIIYPLDKPSSSNYNFSISFALLFPTVANMKNFLNVLPKN